MPTTGAVGLAGDVLITTSADSSEVHPLELVTVNVWEPATRPDTVTVVVDPVILPGFTVQLPAGSPPSTTLPVDNSQVGWWQQRCQ